MCMTLLTYSRYINNCIYLSTVSDMRLRFTYLCQLCGNLETDLHEIFREGNMGDGGGGHWLVRMEWRPAGCSVYLTVDLKLLDIINAC